MQGAHLFDLPPELIVRILKETVSRYLNALIEKHRGALAKQSIYMAIFKQMRISDELAEELARRLSALKSSVFRLSFVRCHLSAKAFIALISALKPQQLTIEFDLAFDGISSRVLCDHVSFREDWYNGKRSIQDYHLSISERIVPERLFHGLTTRRRSIIAWELRNFNSVLHVSIIGPGVSIAKVFNLLECS
ncbi:unnamed protein product [Heligmosomoides polygyrus]|uniref:F-box domain-containing protein n=1 Tax=Heligmosomoides polygyrus TaxID=6339 RepID=A0A183FR77_HELPZ|nr:unnamed protein product [Heligmosomoides polygyrus]